MEEAEQEEQEVGAEVDDSIHLKEICFVFFGWCTALIASKVSYSNILLNRKMVTVQSLDGKARRSNLLYCLK